MEILKEKSIKDFILVHVFFAIIAAITLLFPFQAAISGKLLVLGKCIFLNRMLPIIAK